MDLKKYKVTVRFVDTGSELGKDFLIEAKSPLSAKVHVIPRLNALDIPFIKEVHVQEIAQES